MRRIVSAIAWDTLLDRASDRAAAGLSHIRRLLIMYYKVVIQSNLVRAITHKKRLECDDTLLESNLDAGIALASNNRVNACIDGDYWFRDFEQAKSFAILSLDFVDRQIESRTKAIQSLSADEQYSA